MQWSEYVAQCAEGRKQAELGILAGVDQSTVSRWIRGEGKRPTADNAMALARAAGDSPVVGLLAAGYLREADIDKVVRVDDGLSEKAAEALLIELGRRLGLHVSTRKGAAG